MLTETVHIEDNEETIHNIEALKRPRGRTKKGHNQNQQNRKRKEDLPKTNHLNNKKDKSQGGVPAFMK